MRRIPLIAALLACCTASAAQADPIAASLNGAVAFLEQRVKTDPRDFIAANQLVQRLLRRHRWLGRLEDLRRADEFSQASVNAAPADLNLDGIANRARVLYALHRFAEAAELARQLEMLKPGRSAPQQLLGDALLEMGDVAGAERAFAEAVQRSEPSAESEYAAARLAWQRGDPNAAAGHLNQVVALCTDDPIDTRVWALVQRGEFAFRRGEHAAAEKDYLAAEALAPTQWSVQAHLAELRGAQGRHDEAAALFEAAARATGRPEFWHHLADLHLFYQQPDLAKPALDAARTGYDDSLARGEVIYVHHLVTFFSDSQPNPERAVTLARQDLDLRKNTAAWDALAWAQYRKGDYPSALAASQNSLASTSSDSHVLYHAGTIHLSAGDIAEGQRLLRRAAQANPHFAGFHIHH